MSVLRSFKRQGHWKIKHIAITLADKVAVVLRKEEDGNKSTVRSNISEFISYEKLKSWYIGEAEARPRAVHDFDLQICMLKANATAFTALTVDWTVWTWGDPRFNACLAREPSNDSLARKPAPLTSLGGIYIDKIASSGWMSGALSRKDGALYVWGQVAPGSGTSDAHRQIKVLEDKSAQEDVALVNIADDEGVNDVAMGAEHIAVVLNDGRLFRDGQ